MFLNSTYKGEIYTKASVESMKVFFRIRLEKLSLSVYVIAAYLI